MAKSERRGRPSQGDSPVRAEARPALLSGDLMFLAIKSVKKHCSHWTIIPMVVLLQRQVLSPLQACQCLAKRQCMRHNARYVGGLTAIAALPPLHCSWH